MHAYLNDWLSMLKKSRFIIKIKWIKKLILIILISHAPLIYYAPGINLYIFKIVNFSIPFFFKKNIVLGWLANPKSIKACATRN